MTAAPVLEMERTLRRLVPPITDLAPLVERGDLRGLFVDCETSGLNPEADRIIQLAAAPFTFTANGAITGVGRALSYLEDPGVPIPLEITRLTGITDDDVRGKRIDDGAVSELAANAVITIAHVAEFDRQFVEKRLPIFKALRWGCSRDDIPWADEGYESTKLRYLMNDHARMFYDGHRADADCYAGLHLLSTVLPSGMRALACVLGAARVSHVRIYATGAPFETKEMLKARGYRWRPGDGDQSRAWYRDVIAGDAVVAEREWLATNVLVSEPMSVQFTARQRFSSRIGRAERG